MTTATVPAAGSFDARRRTGRVLGVMAIGLRRMLVGYWLVMVALFAIGIAYQLVVGSLYRSFWDYGTQSPKYFSSAIGIALTPVFFTCLVAHGVTRRMFAVAGSIYLVGAAAATALLWVLMYQLERGIYAWQDWPQLLNNPHLFDRTTQVGLVFAEFFLLIFSHEVAGWLIGIGFYRFGFWRGVAMLPLGLVPAIAAEFLLVAQWLGQILADAGYHRPPLSVGVPAVLLVSVTGLYVVYLLLRPIGVKPTRG